MNELGPLHYLAIFAGSAVLTLVLVPVAMRVAIRYGILDHPGGYKQQASPVPYLGGLAIVLAFSLAVLLAAVVRPPATGLSQLGVVMVMAVGLSVVGLADDLRSLGPYPRLAIMVASALWLWHLGIGVRIFDEPAPDALLTMLWIVGITNAFNLLDNMDGLSAGTSAIAAASFFLIAALNGQFLVAALSIALAGCALGFLRHNYHPARIYMGDAGSLFLGFMLAVLGVQLEFDAPREITFLVPIVVLGIAIFDTTLVTVTRVSHRLNPMVGGRDHTSHRLVFIGLPVRVAVGSIHVAGALLGWLAYVVSRLSDRLTAYILVGLTASIAVLVGVLLGCVPVHERSRRRRLMITEVARHEVEPIGVPDCVPTPQA